jgi:histidinol-phosphate aminotransferase
VSKYGFSGSATGYPVAEPRSVRLIACYHCHESTHSKSPPAARQLAPYVPGKPLSELEREYGITDSVKLASNENPLGPGPKARAAIAQSTQSLGLYPDGNGFELKQALANKHGCAPEQITLGNGSNDLLVMLAEAFLDGTTEAVYSQYCFAIYPIVVQATGAVARVAVAYPAGHDMALGHDLQAMRDLVNERTRLVFCQSQQPDGHMGGCDTVEGIHRFVAVNHAHSDG